MAILSPTSLYSQGESRRRFSPQRHKDHKEKRNKEGMIAFGGKNEQMNYPASEADPAFLVNISFFFVIFVSLW